MSDDELANTGSDKSVDKFNNSISVHICAYVFIYIYIYEHIYIESSNKENIKRRNFDNDLRYCYLFTSVDIGQ